MSEESLAMTGAEAIRYVADVFNVPSMYAMARDLSDETLNVQPIQIKNYLTGTRMSKKVADRFKELYDVIITDAFDPSGFRKDYKSRI